MPGEVGNAVGHALKSGYRHLDCALIYQNGELVFPSRALSYAKVAIGLEKEVGDAIKDSGIPRKEIFITSKVCVSHLVMKHLLRTNFMSLQLEHPPIQCRRGSCADVEGSPNRLFGPLPDSLASVRFHPLPCSPRLFANLFLHVSRLIANETSQLFPTNPDGTRSVDSSWDQRETWKQMEQVYRSGKVKAIGVSNFSIPYLENLEKTWEVVPVVNQVRSSILTSAKSSFIDFGLQVELHPYCPQHALKEWCEKRDILLEAYCPLGSTSTSLNP